jgi:hypothetical protein
MARVHQSWGLRAIVADAKRLENPVGKSRGKFVPIRAPRRVVSQKPAPVPNLEPARWTLSPHVGKDGHNA